MNKRNEDRQNIKKCKMRTAGHFGWRVRAASKPVWQRDWELHRGSSSE